MVRDWEKELTYKQLFFCKEYLANNGNASKAALAAGYKKETAKATGAENLTKPVIREYLDILNARRNARLDADADWIVESLRGLASANMVQNSDGVPVDSTAANKSLELIGKTHGIFVDRHDITAHLVQVDAPKQLELGVWEAEIAQRAAQLPDNTDDNSADVG